MATDKQIIFKTLISANECQDIVRKALDSNEVEIVDYQIDEIRTVEILGFLGQYFRLKVKTKKENEKEKEIIFFVKSLPLENQVLKADIELLGFFRKEIQIFKTIFSQIKQTVERKWHPDCFLIRDDIFVFEDLKVIGYDHICKRESFPINYMKAALTALARMHASTMKLMEQNDLLAKTENVFEKYNETFIETYSAENTYITSGMTFIEMLALRHPLYGEKYKEQIEKDLLKIMYGIFDKLEPSKKFKNVFCHRDLWVNNLLFKKSEFETSCMILDYQICRVCPPAFDFLFIVYFNSRKSDRERLFKEYQEFYYSSLVEESQKISVNADRLPSHDEFLESCEFYKLIPLVLTGVYIPRTHLPEGYFSECGPNNPEKFKYIFCVDRSEMAFEQMEKDEYYRDYLFENVGELIEEFIIKKNN